MAEGGASPLRSSLSADDIDKSPKKPGKLSADILGKFESDPALSSSPGQSEHHIGQSPNQGSSSDIEPLTTSRENVKSHRSGNVRIKVPDKDAAGSADETFSEDEQDRKRHSRWKLPGWRRFRKFFSRKKQPHRTKSCEDLPTEHYKPISKKTEALIDESNLRLRAKSDPSLVPGGKKRPKTIAVADVHGKDDSDNKTPVSRTVSMPPPVTQGPGRLLQELKSRQSSSHEEIREEKIEVQEETPSLSITPPSKAVSLPSLHTVVPGPPLVPASGGSEEAVSFDTKVSTSSLEGFQAAHDKIKAAPKHRRPPTRNRSRTSSLNTTVSAIKEDPASHKRSKTDPQDVSKITTKLNNAQPRNTDVVIKTIVEGSEDETSAASSPVLARGKDESKKTAEDVKADVMARANKILAETPQPAKVKASTLPVVSKKTEKLDKRISLRDTEISGHGSKDDEGIEKVVLKKVEPTKAPETDAMKGKGFEVQLKNASKVSEETEKENVSGKKDVVVKTEKEEFSKTEEDIEKKIQLEKAIRKSWTPSEESEIEKVVLRKVEKAPKAEHEDQEALMEEALSEIDKILDSEMDLQITPEKKAEKVIEKNDAVIGKEREKKPDVVKKGEEIKSTVEAEKVPKKKPVVVAKISEMKFVAVENENEEKTIHDKAKVEKVEKGTEKPKEEENEKKGTAVSPQKKSWTPPVIANVDKETFVAPIKEKLNEKKPVEIDKGSEKPKESENVSKESAVSPRKQSWPPQVNDAEKGVAPKPTPPVARGKSWSLSRAASLEETLIIVDKPKPESKTKGPIVKENVKPVEEKKNEKTVPEPLKKPVIPEKKPGISEKKPGIPEKKPVTPEKKPGIAEKKPVTPEKKPDKPFMRTKSWSVQSKNKSDKDDGVQMRDKPSPASPGKDEESGDQPAWIAMANRASKRFSQLLQDDTSTEEVKVPISSEGDKPAKSPTSEPESSVNDDKPLQPKQNNAPTPQKPPASNTVNVGAKARSASLKTPSPTKTSSAPIAKNRSSVHDVGRTPFAGIKIEKCAVCGTTVYQMEKCKFDDSVIHRNCIKCTVCNRHLTVGNFVMAESKIYCNSHSHSVMVS